MHVDFTAEPPDGQYTRPAVVAHIDEANLIASRVQGDPYGDTHKVVIDLDMPAQLIPSSTPGHFHLLIDAAMPWSAYLDLLRAMMRCGLLEPGYVSASEERGYTAVRLPWVRKDSAPRQEDRYVF